ncbi:MAG: hypothetical protein R3C55_00795 [Parvularculaceae bacterium]
MNAILFMAVMAGALALSGTFAALAVISTLSRLFVYLASLAALPVIRRKRGCPSCRRHAPRRPGDPRGRGAFFCLWAVFQSSLRRGRPWRALSPRLDLLRRRARARAAQALGRRAGKRLGSVEPWVCGRVDGR